MKERFRRTATSVSNIAGSAWVFCLALLVVIAWAVSGKFFNYSDTWQLVINTGTTIVTFLMVFLIQNTQNRDGKAMQLKLDELIRATTKANDNYIDIEALSDEELAKLSEQFSRIKETEKVRSAAIEKFHGRVKSVLNARVISIPGEKAVTRFIPFTGKPVEEEYKKDKDTKK